MSKVKCSILLTALLLICLSAHAEDLINGPESVEFDEARNRYLVSNWNDGTIVEIDSLGNQSYFKTGISYCGGICVSGDTLWIAADFPNRVLAVDLVTRDVLLIIYVSEADFFDSIVLDSSGYAYVTEGSSACDTCGRIYRFDIADQSYSVLADSGITRPQAIRFDPEENSLIFCSVTPAIIQKITLNDSTLSTVVESSIPISMDGITFDDFGNTYVSSWTYHGVFRFDSVYTDPPEQIATGYSGPSALYYNKRDNILAVPDYSGNWVGFIEMMLHVESDITFGATPLTIDFEGVSELDIDSWRWDFGDGDSAEVQSPSHTYQNPGIYDIALEAVYGADTLTRFKREYIIALADTLSAPEIIGDPGSTIEVTIYARNTMPLDYLRIPVEYPGLLNIALDSFSTVGCRTEYFQNVSQNHSDPVHWAASFSLNKGYGEEIPELEPGAGPVLKLYFTIPPSATFGKTSSIILDGFDSYTPDFNGSVLDYDPICVSGMVSLPGICGDANGDSNVNILDVSFLINHLYNGGPAPNPVDTGDANGDNDLNILDIVHLINYLYNSGPDPVC